MMMGNNDFDKGESKTVSAQALDSYDCCWDPFSDFCCSDSTCCC